MIFPGLPVNCLQGIEQEMGIDLILQHLQLVFTDEHLLHIIVLDQPVHMADHILKPVTNLLSSSCCPFPRLDSALKSPSCTLFMRPVK